CKNSIFSTNATFLHPFSAKPPLKITPYSIFSTHFSANCTKIALYFTKSSIFANSQFISVIAHFSTIHPHQATSFCTNNPTIITKPTNKRVQNAFTLFIKGIAL
ncbi:MAG: hypothetical protein J6Q45_06535, partial [Alistipes sp.]|nr:hypothetical protein [Alistipes sp.]